MLDETKRIAAGIDGAKLRIIPGEGHGSYIVHNTRIADIIMEETGICEPAPEFDPDSWMRSNRSAG